MRLFKRKRPRETCPVFLMDGESVVDVVMTEWEETSPGKWDQVSDSPRVDIHQPTTSATVETPVGCFDIPIPRLRAGDTLMFAAGDSGGPALAPCRRISQAEHSALSEGATV